MSVMTETEFQRRLVQLCERLTEEEKAEWRQTLYSYIAGALRRRKSVFGVLQRKT